MPVTSNPTTPTPLMMGKKLSNPKVWDGWESLQVDADGMLFPIAKAFQSLQSEVATMCRRSHPTQYHTRTLGFISYTSCSTALTLVHAPYSVSLPMQWWTGCLRTRCSARLRGVWGERRRWNAWARNFNAPGLTIGYFARRAHRLHLLEACLVSVAEFTADSGHL